MLCNGFFHKCWRHDPSCKQCKKQRPTSSLCHDLKSGSRGSEIHSNNHLSKKRKKKIFEILWGEEKNDWRINMEHWLFPFSVFPSDNHLVMGMWPRELLQGNCHTIRVNVRTTEWMSLMFVQSKAWLPLYARLQSLCKVYGFASWQNQLGPTPSLANQ